MWEVRVYRKVYRKQHRFCLSISSINQGVPSLGRGSQKWKVTLGLCELRSVGASETVNSRPLRRWLEGEARSCLLTLETCIRTRVCAGLCTAPPASSRWWPEAGSTRTSFSGWTNQIWHSHTVEHVGCEAATCWLLLRRGHPANITQKLVAESPCCKSRRGRSTDRE